MKKQLAIFSIVAIAALAGGLYFGKSIKHSTAAIENLDRAAVLGASARQLPEFELMTHAGAPMTPDGMKGRWSVMFFGYTYCPDICPVTMTVVKEAIRDIRERTPMDVYFVSVDPERDTLPRLKEYVTYFDPAFIGATGTEANLAALAKGIGIVYRRPDTTEGENYLVDHSANIIVVNPAGQVYAVLSTPHEPTTIARNLDTILGYYSSS